MLPREFLSLAERLSREPSESAWRSAVSRAYYAMFHESRDRLAAWRFLTRQSDQAHVAVSRRLGASQVKGLVDLGRALADMKRERNRADYDLPRPFSQSDSLELVERVDAVQSTAFDLSADEQRVAIDNMRRYERDVLREVTWQSPN